MKNLILFIFLLVSYSQSAQHIFTQGREIIDLTHAFSSETVYWVTAQKFSLEEVAKGRTENGYYYSANNFSMAEHGGTHIDAPIHFAENKRSLDELPLEQLIGMGVKIDVSDNSIKNPDYLISVKDLEGWEELNGKIPENSIVLFETGFGKYYPETLKYLGTNKRGTEAVKNYISRDFQQLQPNGL